MCRFVTVVIFVSCVSFGVLAEGDRNTTCTLDDAELSAKKQEWQQCFIDIVEHHLNPHATGHCHNATDFGEQLDNYIKLVNTKCSTKIILDTNTIIKLIEFSLKNDSFKKFYDDIVCVRQYESKISNDCVNTKVGFFNITQEKKHTSWVTKGRLAYDSSTCSTNKKVDACVQSVLYYCKPDTIKYMKNLFEYARELGNCSQFPETTSIPPADGTGAAAVPWLTTPVIITLSIGALVVVVAIIIIVVLKCKNK